MKKEKEIQTRLNEVRIKTLEPKKMLNMYLAERVIKKWNEDFVDQDSGEVVSIERTEKLFESGLLIDQDLLAKIQFSIQAGEIIEPIEVSNQHRSAHELVNGSLCLWTAKAEFQGSKKKKFLLYGQNIEQVIDILRDYIELNFEGAFYITNVKDFKNYIILDDTLSDPLSEDDINTAYLRGEIDLETYVNALHNGAQDDDKPSSENQKKYYSLSLTIKYHTTDDDEGEFYEDFLVHTFDSERTLLVIKAYLKMRDEEEAQRCKSAGNEFIPRTYNLSIEKLTPLNVGYVIPQEFSLAYKEE